MTEHEWVVEALRFYRPLDFFLEFAHLSDEQLANELIARHARTDNQSFLEIYNERKEEAAQEHEEWEIGLPEVWADMLLVSEDTNRVWWDDGEVEIYSGAEIYTNFLKDCSRISRGAFMIDKVEEEWEDQVLTNVSFDFGGERWAIRPSEMYGWIDWEILGGVNQLIKDSGYQFLMHETGDQTTFIVVLSEAEMQKLENARQWDFWVDEEE